MQHTGIGFPRGQIAGQPDCTLGPKATLMHQHQQPHSIKLYPLIKTMTESDMAGAGIYSRELPSFPFLAAVHQRIVFKNPY
jgi:hypothetical protein